MCGIAGSINHKLDIPRLTKDLWHRGPDEQSTFEEANLQLHHHRLSILDIEAGKQPMQFEHLTIIFNGEIYNHLELRKTFGLHSCKTHSDTETILHLYALQGAACLNVMDGMFAIVIYDKKKQELFFARDRAGKKPFYYFSGNNTVVFASELNALYNQMPLEINDTHIQQYLRLGFFYKSATPYKNVLELPAGTYATVALSNPEVKPVKWWDINHFYSQPSADSFELALEKVDAHIHKAVRNRVESSDLEVGSFLSGGIDSGLITAIAKQYNQSLKTFTVSFDGEYNEAPLAKLVADKYQTSHYEINISFRNLVDDIENILLNYGEPFYDSSAIPSYYVSKAAKEHLTVILNGDGGDEIFGGYRRYVPFAKFDFFKSGTFVKKLASGLFSILPAPADKKSKYNYIYRLADLARKKGLDIYLSSTTDIFEGYGEYLKDDNLCLLPVKNGFTAINQRKLSGLQKIMNLDFDNILAGDLLVKMDIATMANSLEGRSPLLCKEILEYAPALPDSFKIKGTQTKYILRKLAQKYLPPELINQPKRGFEPPQKKWVDNELKPIIGDYLLSDNSYYQSFVDKQFVKNLIDKKIKVPDEKRTKMLWSLFALEIWYQRGYKRNKN